MEFPAQQSGSLRNPTPTVASGLFDPRAYLNPTRLTMVMWDNAFLMRHHRGGAFEDYDCVLDQAIERGYNTLRLDPMPQFIDLAHPGHLLKFPDPQIPFMPWNQNQAVEAPMGEWLISFMEKLLERRSQLNYTLSGWWFHNKPGSTWPNGPALLHRPTSHGAVAEVWHKFLEQWQKRFGFDGCVYVDLANEVPYFTPDFLKRYQEETGQGWMEERTPKSIQWLANDLNSGLALLQRAFPQLRFTASIHGDVRWTEVPVHFDCLDVHFYAQVDKRWENRTRFSDYAKKEILFQDDSWHQGFSEACTAAHSSMAPMFRAHQRGILAKFADWARSKGMPLTTSESWSSWFYIDSPGLNWDWLLDWAEWSVEDALEFGMWGWTPHNYCQPQFANWKNVRWHQRLTSKFLKG